MPCVDNNLKKMVYLRFAMFDMSLGFWRWFRTIKASFTFLRFTSPKERRKADNPPTTRTQSFVNPRKRSNLASNRREARGIFPVVSSAPCL